MFATGRMGRCGSPPIAPRVGFSASRTAHNRGAVSSPPPPPCGGGRARGGGGAPLLCKKKKNGGGHHPTPPPLHAPDKNFLPPPPSDPIRGRRARLTAPRVASSRAR